MSKPWLEQNVTRGDLLAYALGMVMGRIIFDIIAAFWHV